ncbi:MAG TPA: hypothetical protein VF939_16695 [Puia sp.]
MKRKIFIIIDYLVLFILPVITTGQVTITNTGPVTLTGAKPVVITGNFTNTSTGAWTNNGDLTITGNITNNQAGMAPGTGITRLAGTAVQTIGGGQPFVVNTLFLTNSAGYTLNQSLQVAGVTTFTNGIVTATTAATPMIFDAAATLSGVSGASHVNGYVRRLGTTAFTYPVGDASLYRKIDITPGSNASGIDCRYFKGDAGPGPFTSGGASLIPLVAYNKAEYWDLHPVTTANSLITIYYDQVVPPGKISSTADLKVAHLSGGNWLDESGTANGVDVTAGSVTATGISTWSPFTLGSTSLNSPLPVTLISFSGLLVNNVAQLNWEVADEVNLRTYGVEKSCNGVDYSPIGEVAATNSHSYQYADASISCRVAYYRLRLEDIDGKYKYSPIISINSGNSNGITIMPNPVEDRLVISFGTGTGGTYAISLIDMSGRRVFHREQPVSDGETILWNRPSQIQGGNYVLSLRNLEKGVISNFKILVK